MIRWIRAQLGTAAYRLVSENDAEILDVRDLVDKGGNAEGDIRRLLDRGASSIRNGRTVIVCCDFGISRSNAIAAGILSIAHDIPFDEALDEVAERTGEPFIKIEMIASVRSAVGRNGPPPQAPGQVLITGASGFLGMHVATALRQRRDVLTPDSRELNLAGTTALLDRYCDTNGVQTIVHLAYPRVYTNGDAIAAALVMLRSILDVCRLRRIRLFYVSGAVVFSGYESTALAVDEQTALFPKGIYGDSKYLEESLVDVYFRRGEIDRTICRLAAVYGPRGQRPRFIRTFYERLRAGETVATHRFRNGRPALDLLFVDDAVRAIEAALSYPDNSVFHFGSGRLETTADLARSIAAIVERDIQLTETTIDDYTSNILLRSDRAAQLLGWTPSVPLETGLRATLEAFTA